jgi:hypothetical protein
MQTKYATILRDEQTSAPNDIVELRGPSGRLYGRLNLKTLELEVKCKNEAPERIDLRQFLQAGNLA